MLRPIAVFLLALGLVGCTRDAARAATPARSYPRPEYGWPPPVVSAGSAPAAPTALIAGVGASAELPHPAEPATWSPAPAPAQTVTHSPIPGGRVCLDRLDAAGVKYARLEDKRGMETPIHVTGPIGGIRYVGAGQPLICDCRLALALHAVAPTLRELGVTELRFSGAYSYRLSRVGRLSLHAYGLALDVHEGLFGGKHESVRTDFSRGIADGCTADSPAFNQLACRLKATGLFRELLTPDYDADHHDHVHLGIAPLAGPAPRIGNDAVQKLAKKKRAPAPAAPQRDDADAVKYADYLEPVVVQEPEPEPKKSKKHDKRSGRSPDKASDKQADKASDKQADKASDKQADRASDKQADTASDKQADKASDKQADKASDRPIKKNEKQADKADKASDKPTDAASDRPVKKNEKRRVKSSRPRNPRISASARNARSRAAQ